MAKSTKKKETTKNIKEVKTPKQSSDLFHEIMKASVKGNPKPKSRDN